MKKAPAALGSSLVEMFKKGTAAPTPAVAGGHAARTAFMYHKALTLKLDEGRYRALKLAGLESDMSSQDILVQALDQWLSRRDAERPVDAHTPSP